MANQSILMSIPLKEGCLAQYLAFAKEAQERATEYKEMLLRYDIHSAKVWTQNISGRDYVFVYHDVGPNFEEKMKGWDTSAHPFDTWFRESIMAVYDISSVEDMGVMSQAVDFTF